MDAMELMLKLSGMTEEEAAENTRKEINSIKKIREQKRLEALRRQEENNRRDAVNKKIRMALNREMKF